MTADMIRDVPGPVLELGLGNGRTYDHLRELLPGREIFVFDRQVAAHPDCIPDDAHMILGDITETMPGAMDRIGDPAALAHCDIGTGSKAANQQLIAVIAPLLDKLMRRGGIVVCDQEYDMSNWTLLPLPDGVAPGRYYVSRVE